MQRESSSNESASCESCGEANSVQFCEGCNDYYCDQCWEKRRAHRENRLGPSGIPHTPLNPVIVRQVEKWMAEPTNEADEQTQHAEDEETIWFGLGRDFDGNPMLAEYRRFASIMMETSLGTQGLRYPGLVSFVGQTGSGKSTLIRILMSINSCSPPIGAPVIGRSNVEVPTSADVHLYMDPNSDFERPILYADCEGFEGGEREPIAQTVSSATAASLAAFSKPNITRVPVGSKSSISRILHFTKRALRWASRNAQDHVVKGKRQYAVAEMYPRIFHAFSDVVVFVLNNPKTMEDVVEKLLLWADANYTSSINLPSKPHAVIALNKSNSSTPGDQWSRHRATEDFFKSMNPQLHKNKTFDGYVRKWAKSHRYITSMQELFECYYSSIHVVRIPDKSRYQVLHEQGQVLKEVIDLCCANSFQKKKDRKMLPDADQFQVYLSLAFDHFSNTLEEPFDYVKASFQYRPPSEDSSQNLMEFILLFAEATGRQGQIKWLFTKVTKLVASCVMLDAARNKRFGNPQDWFHMHAANQNVSYKSICDDTITSYYENRVPCAFEKPSAAFYPKAFKCETPKKLHGTLHRGKGVFGAVDEYGRFEDPSGFDRSVALSWSSHIRTELLESHNEDNRADVHQSRIAAHGRVLRSFFTGLECHNLVSSSICLACLFNPAHYTLMCGHIVCRDCVLDFGYLGGPWQVILESCPLSCDFTARSSGEHKLKPSVIRLQPEQSGLRVLTLDGGGIRGVIELVILKAIEDRIGVPLQRFFDLVVGTSTGGIISLGFGHNMWPLSKCITTFQDLVKRSFIKRPFADITGLKHVEILLRKSKYYTKPLAETLRESLGTAPLFGLPREGDGSQDAPLNVAVLATTGSGTTASVLSNYNVRKWVKETPHGPKAATTEKEKYMRERPSRSKDEMQIWEAARATSAAPGYFKPFVNRSGLELLDGAVLHNNPIEVAMTEASSIAHYSNMNETPDIVVSLGTGLQKDYKYDEDPGNKATRILGKMNDVHPKVSFLQMLFTMIKYQVKLNLDAERRWVKWRQAIQGEPLEGRVFRINPDFGEAPPLLDEVDKFESLLHKTTGWLLNTPEVGTVQITEIACRLVASSFYFERTGEATRARDSSVQIPGIIQCRLNNESEDIKGLGRFLRSSGTDAAFIITAAEREDQRILVPVREMVMHGAFQEVALTVAMADEEASTSIALELTGYTEHNQHFYISGFPRKLLRQGS